MKASLSTTGLLDQLDRIGLVELDPYIDSMPCIEQTLTELASAFASAKHRTDVDSDGITMQTLNGDALLDACPSVGHMYQYTLQSLRREIPALHEISARSIGLSANLLQGAHDKFRMHFDRNQLTAIVYLNDVVLMPLIAYPNVRRDPLMAGEKEHFSLDGLVPYVIEPRTNTGLVFLGRRTYHGIDNRVAQSGTTSQIRRYSLQFAFDFAPCDYDGQSYYGMGIKKIGESA